MKLPIHNPARPIGGRRKKKSTRRARRTEERATMAKKKKRKKGRRNPARSHVSKPKKRRKARRANPSSHTHRTSAKRKSGRRRRNPGTSSGGKKLTIGKIAIAALAGVAAAVSIPVTKALLAPNSDVAGYGLAGAGVIGGAMLAKKHPAIGVAVAAGSLATVAVPPLTQYAFNALAPSKGAPTQGAIHRMNAIHRQPPRLGAFRPGMAPFHAVGPFGAATS